LDHFAADAAPDHVLAALVRDGACIVDDVLDADTVAAVRAELEPILAITAPGVEEFSGLNTRRFGSLIERAPSTRPLITHPRASEIVTSE
jgi:hypothetical protein